MTTGRQDREFMLEVVGETLLEKAIKWIADNLNPQDVFDAKQMGDWASDNGYTKETP